MDPREGALKVIYEVDIRDAFSNIALNKEIKKGKYSLLDKNLLTELVYGVLENKIFIDYVIKDFSSIKIDKMDPWTLNLLRIGTYQLMFLDKIPSFAVVNESVNLSKKYCKRSTGFINGVLRNIVRKKETIKLPKAEENYEYYLSVKYSHPQWLVDQLLLHFSKEFVESLLKANNERPYLYIRVNTLKTTVENCKKQLEDLGIKVQTNPYIKEALMINSNIGIEQIPLYQKGYIHVQDLSSMLVAKILDPQEGDIILDACSAPGGKTTHIAQLMNNKGKIIARDIYDHKLELVRKNAKRLGITIIETEKYNGIDFDKNLEGKIDKVLVDAPCSGLGIIRRKPDIKFRKKPEDIEEITSIQMEILKKASRYVKAGGELVYSTCTIDPRENEGLVQDFLSKEQGYELIDIVKKYQSMIPGTHESKYIQLYPNLHDTDGFFIAKMKKIK